MTTAITYRLLLVQPSVVFAARVNQATIPADAASVMYDGVTTGAYTDIRSEMLVCFGTSAGADDLGRARVRKDATADTLYIGWVSRGKGEGEAILLDNAYITVLDLYKPWTKNPRIDTDGVQYLDYDRDFATYSASPPIVNLDCGTAVQRDLDPDTELATFEFNAIHTYMTDPDADAMYTDWLWELPAEATVTGGALNSHQIEFTLPIGAWWVSAYETASTGAVGVRRVLCVAGEPDGTLTKFDQLELTRRLEGQTLRVRVSESIPESTYPNGCMAVLWKRQTEDGAAVTPSGLPGHEHIAFVGWHYTDELNGRASERGYIDDTYMEFRDLGGWLQVQPGYPITINRDETPASWYEVRNANIDYAIARLIQGYSNAADLTDFHWTGAGYEHYPFPSLASQGTTLYEMIDYFARAVAHRLTCDQWGRLHVKPDPQLLDNVGGSTPVARTAVVQKALTDADISELRITETPFPRQNWNWGEAVVAKSQDADVVPQIDVVFAVAPGQAPSQGTATAQTGEQLTTTQAEFNARLGHAYARANTPTSGIEFVLTSPDDFAIQPAYMTWLTLTTSTATAGQRGRVYSAQRVLPAQVTITHDAERGTQTVSVQAEREVYGLPAATYYPPSNDYGDVPPWTPPDPVAPPTSDWGLGAGVNRLFLIHKSGELSVTSTFLQTSGAGGPGYAIVDLSLDGTVLDAVTDPYSPLYLGTGTTVNAWIVTTTRIYYVEDVAGVSSRSVTLQHTFAAETPYRTIQTERGVRNWVLVSSYYAGAGVKVARTTDGSTWTEVTVSSTIFGGDTFGPTGEYDWAYDVDLTQPLPSGWTAGVGTWVEGVGITDSISRYDHMSSVTTDYFSGSGNVTHFAGHVASWPSNPGGGGVGPVWYGGPGGDWYDSGQVGNAWIIRSGFSGAYNNNGRIFFARQYQFTVSGVSGTSTIDRLVFAGTGDPPFPGLSVYEGEIGGVVTPTLHVSGKTAGLAYTGALSGSTGRLYKTTDYGATWTLTNLPASDFGQSLGLAFHFPWHNNANELLYYWGKFDGSDYHAYRTEADGTTKTVITPAAGYGPAGPKAWSTSATNRLVTALMATNGTNVAGWLSVDGGDTWAQILPAMPLASGYTGVHVADDTGVLYLYGPGGVAYTGAGGLSRDDRTGNASSSPVVAIGGW